MRSWIRALAALAAVAMGPAHALVPIGITTLEIAQTHVLPEAGLSWTLTNASESLHGVESRQALALVALSASDSVNPRLQVWSGQTLLGTVDLDPPAQLPPTEDSGPAYATDRYSAVIPSQWFRRGVRLRVLADNYAPSAFRKPLVGPAQPMTVRVLPFYLFGANDGNSVPLASVAAPDAATRTAIFNSWPVSTLAVTNHPARRAVWPTVVMRPNEYGQGNPAYVMHNTTEQASGFQIMGTILDILGRLMQANGEASGPYQYYAPLLMLDQTGTYHGPGGGLGTVGGDTGVGDASYSGIFIHEQGHAMGLPHAGEAYDAGRYPYLWGSLAGSAWGFDFTHNEFLAPFVPPTASRYATCAGNTFAGHARAIDGLGRCVKQDPMQSGSGDQAAGYRFATFSDYSTAVMQRHFEGTTTIGGGGAHVYSGGNIIADAAFAGGYRRWDGIDRKWVNVNPVTTTNGIYGFDQGLPLTRNVPVYAIVVTYSYTGTAGASRIYPPLRFRGNLMRTIDPTDTAQLASIVPDTSTYPWYCRNGGCDYTLRVTYADASVRHVLLQGGFRPFNQASGTPAASASEPTNGNSFRTFVVNVPDDGPITRLELLDTPMVWNGMPANPAVLVRRL